MRRFSTLTVAIVITALLLTAVVAQSRARRRTTGATSSAPASKRAVTINLVQGNPIKGLFISADADTIELEVSGRRTTLKTYQVTSIQFAPDEPILNTISSNGGTPAQGTATAKAAAPTPTPTPDTVMPAARRAYTALRKLADASQLGLPYPQYASLLLETKANIDEACRALPEGGLKAEITQAMETYADAGRAWAAMAATGALPIAADPGLSLMNKYNIPAATNQLGQQDRILLDVTLNTIWAAGAARVSTINGLVR